VILFQLEKFLAKPRIYLRAAILLVVIVSIIDELIYLKQYNFVVWIYPVYIAGFYAIYPLIYIYARDLVFISKDKNRPQVLTVLAFPLFMLAVISIIFYPLDHDSKIKFVCLHLAESGGDLARHEIFQHIVLPAYYLQTIFYVVVFSKLISTIKKNTGGNPWKLLLAKYILAWVVAIVFYESMTIANVILFKNFVLIRIIEQALSLLFISLGLYIGLKQSLLFLQSRITKYTAEADDNAVNKKYNLLEHEKLEIKEAIENYFGDTKIYLDPNLKIESLSKKIHITARRISIAINKVYGANFNHFINEFRISDAKKLIAVNPRNVKLENILTKVGFNSRSAFNHAFKESTGVSPIDYIKSEIEKQST